MNESQDISLADFNKKLSEADLYRSMGLFREAFGIFQELFASQLIRKPEVKQIVNQRIHQLRQDLKAFSKNSRVQPSIDNRLASISSESGQFQSENSSSSGMNATSAHPILFNFQQAKESERHLDFEKARFFYEQARKHLNSVSAAERDRFQKFIQARLHRLNRMPAQPNPGGGNPSIAPKTIISEANRPQKSAPQPIIDPESGYEVDDIIERGPSRQVRQTQDQSQTSNYQEFDFIDKLNKKKSPLPVDDIGPYEEYDFIDEITKPKK